MNAKRARRYAFWQPDLGQYFRPALPQPSYTLKRWSVFEADLAALLIKVLATPFDRRVAELFERNRRCATFIIDRNRSASICDLGTRGVAGTADDPACACSITVGLPDKLK